MQRIWARLVFPLSLVGGGSVTLATTLQYSPKVGKLLMLNPIIYGTEIIRASTLPPQNHIIPFFVSFILLIIFAGLFFYVGFTKLQTLLDFP